MKDKKSVVQGEKVSPDLSNNEIGKTWKNFRQRKQKHEGSEAGEWQEFLLVCLIFFLTLGARIQQCVRHSESSERNLEAGPS